MNEPDGTFPRSITVRRAWLLVGFMWVAYLLNYTDRSLFLTNLAATGFGFFSGFGLSNFILETAVETSYGAAAASSGGG